MAIIRNTSDNKIWGECGDRGASYTVSRNITSVATLEILLEDFFKKIELDLPCDPVIPLLGIHPMISIFYYRDPCISIFTDMFY